MTPLASCWRLIAGDVTKNSSARITQKCMLIFTDHLFMYIECVPWGYHLWVPVDVLSRGVWVDNLAGLVNNNNMSHMTCSIRHICSDDITDFWGTFCLIIKPTRKHSAMLAPWKSENIHLVEWENAFLWSFASKNPPGHGKCSCTTLFCVKH